MKRLYSLPTDRVILDCLANDVIDRNQDVVRFCTILDSFHECTVISLDGAWGSGKTFFVKQAKMLIDGFTDPSVFDKEIEEGFELVKSADNSKYSTFSLSQKHSTVYYDAWENDNDNDPILSIIYAVTKSKQVNLRIRNDRSAVDILSALADCMTGLSIASFSKAVLGTDPIGEIKQKESISNLMQDFFDKAVGNKNDRLVIFIDELDRCKPTFAVALLERIKHYFTDDRLTFVFSVNLDQLQHTIKSFYGNGINASKYLEKLFDFSIPLPDANYEKYIYQFNLSASGSIYDAVSMIVIRYFHFGLREISKYILISKATAYDLARTKAIWQNKQDYLFDFYLLYIAPILIGLKLVDYDKYNEFINGTYRSPFVDILSHTDLSLYNNSDFLEIVSHLSNDGIKKKKLSYAELDAELVNLYNILFGLNFFPSKPGRLYIDNAKSMLVQLINPISKYASYTEY